MAQADTAISQDSADRTDILADVVRAAIEVVTPFLLNAIGALAVLVLGLWIAGRIRKLIEASLSRTGHVDGTLRSFLVSLAHYGLIALVVITTLGVFGIPTTSFATILGAAGLAIGLALQGTLGHIASGVMLLAFRPLEMGHYVEVAGHAGSVRKLTLFTTELSTPDNKKVIIPNGEVWASSIVNYSAYGERRIDMVFGVSYVDDLDKAMDIIRREIDRESRILSERETVIAVDTLGDSSVDIICRPWVQGSDYFGVKWALNKSIKERFDREGISIPYPTQTIYNIAEKAN